MLAWIARWTRATFDYNPTFPLSALLLLGGMKCLARDGTPDTVSTAEVAGGIGLLQAYELCLLGVALLALWPRRIRYETTSILIIFGIMRFAAPFIAIAYAIEGRPLEAAGLGASLAVLMTLKSEAIARRIVPASVRERAYDALLYAIAAVGLPVLAWALSTGTGRTISFDTARLLQLGAWWALALLLAPLALRVPDLRGEHPLEVASPTKVFSAWAVRRTGLSLIGLPLLLGSALVLGGNRPVLAFFAPLALVILAAIAAIARAAGAETPRWFTHAPAAAAAGFLLAPLDTLVGRAHFVTQPLLLLAFLPLAAAAVPLIAPGAARSGLRSLALVAGAAPLAFAPTWLDAELYALGVSSAVALVGCAMQRRTLAWRGVIVASGLAARRWGQGIDPGIALIVLAFASIGAGTAIALRRERARELAA
jgi:hypothetical protein